MPPPDTFTHDQHFLEIRERLVRIETQLDQYNETRVTAQKALATAERNASDIAELKVYATENRVNAATAGHMAETARGDLVELKDSVKWKDRTTIVLVFGVLINLLLNVMQSTY